ncbi:hypothetical protein [Streptomyces microflavus]|uniref:hypothetical protein n=1 Tax=Streptomyces microflavus TaxID=1919 RepID=UPI0033B71927
MIITEGAVFDTPFETGCKALTAPDADGLFDGLDSDGVHCSGYSMAMVVAVRAAEGADRG